MRKWMKDALIGWGVVAAFTLMISIITNAPYKFISSVLYALVVSIPMGIPGGILVGRKHEGWAWPFAGGILSAMLVGVLIIISRML
jgi:uncharacterized membrane protein